MIGEPLLTISQALQLAGLAQIAVAIGYLLLRGAGPAGRLVAVCFFVSLGAGLALPLLHDLLPGAGRSLLLALSAGIPAVSYPMLRQVLSGERPRGRHLAPLLLPLLVWPAAVPASAGHGLCAEGEVCDPALLLFQVAEVVVGGLLLLGGMWSLERLRAAAEARPNGPERIGLAVALVAINAGDLLALLAHAAGRVTASELTFVQTVLSLTFAYLATTMLFRIYPERAAAAVAAPVAEPPPLPAVPVVPVVLGEADLLLAERIRVHLVADKPYCREGFRREDLAAALEVPEHRLSKVINAAFGQSFSELVNGLRVEEAKRLLATTSRPATQIAFDSGFNSLASFNRVFKSLCGRSPTAYREAVGQRQGVQDR